MTAIVPDVNSPRRPLGAERSAGLAGSVVEEVVSFLERIGLEVQFGQVPKDSFLPGIALAPDGLRVDLGKLQYPGDLLHEAGHLAVMEPERRRSDSPTPTHDGGEEMAAIAWSYAATIHLGLPAEVVFHQNGYKGGSAALCSNFEQGRHIGVPLLQWMGLANERASSRYAGEAVYPEMKQWLRT